MKIVFAVAPTSAERDVSVETSFLPKGARVKLAIYDPNNLDPYYKEIEDADAIITNYVQFGKKEIDKLKKCKVISFQSTGYNGVDIEYAKEKGIAVCAIEEYCTQEVAEHTLSLILALQRGITVYNDSVQIKKEWNFNAMSGVERIEGQTLGIVGLGKIGRAVAKRAQSFGMKTIAYDPYISALVAEEINVELVSIDDILESSNIITIHMNLTSENEAFFNLEKFKKMKKKPYIINVARGAMISEKDLVLALDQGLVKGAGLDVLESEYPDIRNNKLVGRKNVIITPHSAFYSKTSSFLNKKITATNVTNYLQGDFKSVTKIVNGVGL